MSERPQAPYQIRPATPDNAEPFARMAYETHPTLFEDLFGPDRAFVYGLIAHKWLSDKTIDSWTLAHGAYNGDTLIGVEIGGSMPKVRAERSADDDAITEAYLSPEAWAHAGARWDTYWQYCFPLAGAETYYVDTLSVAPEWHGKGVGRALLEAAFERARADGYTDVQLDLYDTNPAFHFYKAVGMDVLTRTINPALAAQGFPNHIRMIKRL